jgi:outer membrane lipoprotein-sorting protein
MGNAWFMADPSGMASFIDNGTTSVTGTTNIEQYITSQRWHLVSPPVSGATINVYYDIYLKEYNEPTDTWTYLIQPTTIPMTQVKGYSAWASNGYTGTTTVTYTGTLNNSDFVLSNLDYTPAAPMTGFNLVGNPFSCALDWNSSWSMSNMSGWMVIYDNGTFRGIHTDGTPYNGKTDGIIPSSQGFWVRALNASASITIPASERVHSGQAFYKETKEIIHPMVRLETEINGYSDETLIIFHPEATAGFDGYYDLAKFENVEEAPQLYTMAVDGNYAVNFYEPDYQEKIIPVGFQTAEEGLYIINASAISNFNGDIGIYLEDLKTSTITKLSDNPQYEFIYDPMDEEHRFNLHFTTEHLGIEEITLSGLKIYSFGQTVYVKNPDQLPGAITIYDVMGQVITTRKTVSNLTEIPITQSSGYYFVKVQTGTALKIEKVFIK